MDRADFETPKHPRNEPERGFSPSPFVLVASGLSIGFLAGWILKGRGISTFRASRVLSALGTVAKYAAVHKEVPRTKLVLVARGDLDMTRGKLAAQCSHAAVGCVENFGKNKDLLELWLNTGQTKVVVRATNERNLLDIKTTAENAGINTFLVKDAGRTELEPGTLTVLGVGPAEIHKVDSITGSLKLF